MICLKGVGYCGFFGGCGFSKLLLCGFSAKTGKEKLIKNKLILHCKKNWRKVVIAGILQIFW